VFSGDFEMNTHVYDYLIVGSGTGGATLAFELAARGKEVLVAECGVREPSLGTFKDCVRYYEGSKITKIPRKSLEGTILWRTLMVGGSSMVACGNGVRCLEEELDEFGIHLTDEFRESEDYLQAGPIDDQLLSAGSHQIAGAAHECGYTFQRMPKYVHPEKCKGCHSCSLGCRSNARWCAIQTIDEAEKLGAELCPGTTIDHVTTQNGKVTGVEGTSIFGPVTLKAKNVILAAGGLGTPVILQRSGIEEAGGNLFIDMLVNVYGSTREVNLVHEPQMALVDLEFHEEDGFILSPFVNIPRQIRLIEAGVRGSLMNANRMLGLMIKTRDEPAGRVFPDGSISKPVTSKDKERLNKGFQIASEILIKAGADHKSIIKTIPQGAHPGGTAAIGTVIDSNMQTRVEGLFVCDASALPFAPGLPPILTIMALARRLSKII
jgi:choline dehydrogenase-like flavoprotein